MAHSLRRRWRYLLAIPIAAFLGILAIGVHAYTRFAAITAPLSDSACCPAPSDSGLEVVQTHLTTSDQISLACWYLPSRNRAAIIILHGERGNRQSMLAHIRLFAQHGYGVLICDRRGHGASTGGRRSWGWLDVGDVAAMLGYLQQRPEVDSNRIGVFGFSMGAQIGLRAASRYPAIHAVVADGPVASTAADLFPTKGLSEWPRAGIDWLDNWFVDRMLEQSLDVPAPTPVVKALAERPAYPLLLISTGKDGDGRELRQVAWFHTVARDPRELWELRNVGHGAGLIKRPDEYSQRVIGFFDTALLERARQP